MNFFKVAKIIAYSILLIVEKLIITFTVNRLLCYEPLCAFSHNSLHYHPCYKGTRVWGRYNVYKSAGALRVNWKISTFCIEKWTRFWFLSENSYTVACESSTGFLTKPIASTYKIQLGAYYEKFYDTACLLILTSGLRIAVRLTTYN